jgi:hypothetical protein
METQFFMVATSSNDGEPIILPCLYCDLKESVRQAIAFAKNRHFVTGNPYIWSHVKVANKYGEVFFHRVNPK